MSLHVVFSVGDAEYVLPAHDVVQMEGWAGATPLPGAPPWVLGLVHLRGAVVPVVDLRARFGLPAKPPSLDDRLVVVQSTQGLVALKVDRARDVLDLDEDAFGPPPALVDDGAQRWVRAVAHIGERMLMNVDFDRVLDGSVS